MKYSLCTFMVLVIWTTAIGQNEKFLAFDTSSSFYYSKTDLSFIDTVKLWTYLLDTTYKGDESESVKPIGRLTFRRTKPIDDGVSERLYSRLWTPRITFDIFKISDLTFCRKQSEKTRLLSSCVPPEVGGDIIVIGKFVLLNGNVCLSCQRYDTKVDYCRPVIHYIFSNIDESKISNIQSLISQFPISVEQTK